MFYNSSKLMFTTTLILSTLLVLSSNNWLSVWMGLEINLISFIPLMFKTKSVKPAESMMIYFLVQAMGSIILLMSILINSWSMLTPNLMSNTSACFIVASLALKLGSAPFHFWIPEVMSKLDWPPCLILSTWQKIAPLTVMSYMSDTTLMLPMMAMLCTLVGAAGGLNQTSLRKIMAYSSISHLGWMIACMSVENHLWMMYLIVYTMLVTMAMLMFKNMSAFYISQITMNSSVMEKFTFTTVMMSMGGLPPFLGFLPKWMVIQSLISKNMLLIMIIMVLTTLITLFYYLRLISVMPLISSTTPKWTSKLQSMNKIMIMIILLNLSTPLAAMINFF
uniref:NADH-ubiquinone oxidoreductase chain 2 n=1 Tax=Nepa hoffmanni TaxID=796936 RepID=A0A0U2HL01_9HEMI|nr:NADH dehydrogenase subunit 2 [Nepa hoffmanni]ALG35799.1 NADH dehydrogenase subunit 2 [Nepa hoffmanni]